ncbi:hypothetical protein HYR99_23650, partial [Candidatus Poribacteria bacterium]|nr:hypothetical protein [Candidatus Poribacteria bacterium]
MQAKQMKKREILKLLERGVISSAEAERLLAALEEEDNLDMGNSSIHQNSDTIFYLFIPTNWDDLDEDDGLPFEPFPGLEEEDNLGLENSSIYRSSDRDVGWTFWRQWVLASTIGWAIIAIGWAAIIYAGIYAVGKTVGGLKAEAVGGLKAGAWGGIMA